MHADSHELRVVVVDESTDKYVRMHADSHELRVVVVDESTESHPVAPGAGEVSDIDSVTLHLFLQPLQQHVRVVQTLSRRV